MGTNYWGSSNTSNFLTEEIKLNNLKLFRSILNNSSTGKLSGGALSIGAPNTTFSIADGSGKKVDNHTDPDNPTFTEGEWSGLTNIAVANFSQPITFVAIQLPSTVIQQSTNFTNSQLRDLVFIGVLTHVGGTVVEAADSIVRFIGSPMNQFGDLTRAIGPINESGNVYAGASLTKLQRSSGFTFVEGGNPTDLKNPNELFTGAENPVTFFQNYQDGVGGFTIVPSVTDIDGDFYDDGSGTLAALNPNRWQIKRIYYGAFSGLNVVHYGQEQYNSMAAAEGAIFSEPFNKNPALNGIPLRGWLIIQEGYTDIENSSQAKFIEAGKFGEGAASGSTSSTTTLQQAYNNSGEPEIVLTPSQGALSIADNSTPIAANLFEVQNNANTEKFLTVDTSGVKAKGDEGLFDVKQGNLDIFYSNDMESYDTANAETGNNATYLGGGALAGTLNKTGTALSGASSLFYTQAAGSLNDYFSIAAITLDPIQKDRTISLELLYDYDGDEGDIEIIAWDSTNSAKLVVDAFYKAGSHKLTLNVRTLATTNEIKFGAQVAVLNSGAILALDNTQWLSSIKIGNITSHNTVGLSSNDGRAITANTESIPFDGTGTGWTSGADGATHASGNFYTVQKGGSILNLIVSVNTTSSTFARVDMYLNGSQYRRLGNNEGGASGQHPSGSYVSKKGEFAAGDKLSFAITVGKTLDTNAVTHYLNIVEEYYSDHVITSDSTDATDSMIRLITSNGNGSTNTVIRRFTTVQGNIGNDMTLTQDGANGDSVTINTAGTYHITYGTNSSAPFSSGISKNSNQLTTNIVSITADHMLNYVLTPAGNSNGEVSWSGYLAEGDVIRAHNDGGGNGIAARERFTITKAAAITKADVIGLISPSKFQKKNLTAQVTSNGVMSDMTFTGLTIGRVYRATMQVFFSSPSAGAIKADIMAGAKLLAEARSDNGANNIFTVSRVFTAQTTSITAVAGSLGGSESIEPGGSGGTLDDGTWLQIEELSHYTETSEW